MSAEDVAAIAGKRAIDASGDGNDRRGGKKATSTLAYVLRVSGT
jgi:hypothetical protein